MGALTADRPKPLIEIAGKNLLQHKIDNLPASVDEVILIVGHMKEKIMEFFGDEYQGRKIVYIDQGEPKGTAHALWQARHLLGDEFISMMGDDIYSPESIAAVADHPWAMTVASHRSFKTAGNVIVDEAGHLKDVVFDDMGLLDSDVLLDVCLYKLRKEVFATEPVQVGGSKEFGLPHTVFEHVRQNGVQMKVIKTDVWIKLNTPEEVAEAEAFFRNS